MCEALRKVSFYLLFLILFVSYLMLSYFGKLHVNPLGLLSSIFVVFTALVASVIAARVGRRTLVVALIFAWLFCALLVVLNWWHSQYFHSYFNFEALKIGVNGLNGIRSFSAMEYKKEALTLLGTATLLSILVVVFYRRDFVRSNYISIASLMCMFFSVFCFLKVDSYIEKVKELNSFTLSPWYLHPAHAFFIPSDLSMRPKDVHAWLRFRNRNNVSEYGNDSHSYADDMEEVRIDRSSYNVIVLVVESFRASLTGYYGENKGLTPYFDSIAKNNLVARNFYANSNYTVKSETSIYCGVFDLNAKLSVAEYGIPIGYECLPRILSKEGYDTYYFHGFESKFYNRAFYHKQMGFESLYFHADQESAKKDGRNYIGWGVSDEDIFDIMLSRLEARKANDRPFFAGVLTLSSHYPFDYEWPIQVPHSHELGVGNLHEERVYLNYQNAIAYADYSLGKFWSRFEESSFYDNTIVVITGDHGIWSFAPGARAGIVRDEEFFRMPLVIYHPELKGSLEIDQISSHIDIPVTLLGMLGVERVRERFSFIGKDLTAPVEEPWAVMMKGGLVISRVKDRVCYVDIPCSGVHQGCLKGEAPNLSGVDSGRRCRLVRGDLLKGGEDVDVGGSYQILDEAFGMVRYENHRLFKNESLRSTNYLAWKRNSLVTED